MKITIDDKTKLNVTSEYYAIMKQRSDKKEQSGYRWEEYMWYTSLEKLIEHLSRKKLSEKDIEVSMLEFLGHYKKVRQEIVGILEKGGVI